MIEPQLNSRVFMTEKEPDSGAELFAFLIHLRREEIQRALDEAYVGLKRREQAARKAERERRKAKRPKCGYPTKKGYPCNARCLPRQPGCKHHALQMSFSDREVTW